MSFELSTLGPRRTVSGNVRELHGSVTELLNDVERQVFLRSLTQYQRDRNVKRLVTSLKSVLSSPRKREIYPLLREIIPADDQKSFDRTWFYGLTEVPQQSKTRNNLAQQTSKRPTSVSPPERLNYVSADSGIDLPHNARSSAHRTREKYPIKRIILKRASTGFGFSIRGGAEHGVGVYVSSVDKDSVADREGLLPGDNVLIVNETRLDGFTHAESVRIIKQNKKLSLTVRSVGRIPNTFIAETTYKWIDTHGGRASPPPDVDSSGRHLTADGIHKSGLRLLGDDDERKVNVFVEDGTKFGLLIRGGAEYGLGIFIAGVDPNAAADQAGLKSGDQIMDVNGRSFLNITHKEAAKFLKSTKNMILTIKDVGRLPLARTTHDKTKWIKGTSTHDIQSFLDACPITDVDQFTAPQHPFTASGDLTSSEHRRHTTGGSWRHNGVNTVERPERSIFHHGIAGTQILHGSGVPSQKHLIAEHARHLLNENELSTMTYYINEYTKGYISINGFVFALFDLLNNTAKMSLLSEIRSSVSPKDLDRFDDLVLKKEIEIMKSQHFMYNHVADDSQSLHSYGSSVSSLSGRGSVSSKSSTKGSRNSLAGADFRSITPPKVPETLAPRLKGVVSQGLDSRPITPPHVPEVLPPNLKVQECDTYEATLTFTEQQVPLEGEFGLPNLLKIDSTNLDPPEHGTVLSPSLDGLDSPILTSTPRDNEDIPVDSNAIVKALSDSCSARTKGEVTVNELTADNATITSEDQIFDGMHSESDDLVMVNGDILSHKTSSALECEPVTNRALCNGDVTMSDDNSFNDSSDKTLTNEVSVNVSQNACIQLGINNNMYDGKPDFGSGLVETKHTVTRKELSVESSPSDWNPVRFVSTNETPDWNPVRLRSGDELPDWKPVKQVSDELTSHTNMYDGKPDFGSGLVETKHTETKKELSVENSSDWNPVRLVSTNETPDWNPVRLRSGDELPDWKPVKLVSDELASRPPVHRKPAKSRPRFTSEDTRVSICQPPNPVNNERDSARSQEPDKPPSPGVHNLVQRYNQMSDDSAESTPTSSRRGSTSSQNRRSWDGVQVFAGDSDERLGKQKQKKKCTSDSSLIVKNLPKQQQKNIQTKRLASQELFDLHQNTKNMVNNSADPEARANNLQFVVLDADGNKTTGTGPVNSLTPVSHDASRSSEFEVEVEKTSMSLGLSIEGGCDTAHKDITVKSVKSGDYSANRSGKLRPGQVILEVDGTSMRRITNGRAVLKIRQAYSSVESSVMKLLIRENGSS